MQLSADSRALTFRGRRHVFGVAWPPAGSSYFHSSFPVSESNARRYESIVAAVKTSLPAVTIGPPRLIDPVSLPGFIVPSGTSQAFLPVNKSTASVVPHGGALQGDPLGEKRNVRYRP